MIICLGNNGMNYDDEVLVNGWWKWGCLYFNLFTFICFYKKISFVR